MKVDIHNLDGEQFLVNQHIKNGKAIQLDGRSLDDDDYKKLLFQCLKK